MDNTQDDISLEDVLGSGTRKPAKPTTQAEPIDPETCPFVIKANRQWEAAAGQDDRCRRLE
jgi:hypothetical protein